MRIYLIVSLLLLSLGLSAQITTNTNFAINSNQPIDTRDTLTTLADTANVDWKYPGLLSYVKDIGQYYYYDNYWKPFNSSSFLFVHVGAYEENYSLPIDTLKKYNRFYITLYAGTSAELTLPSLSGTNLTGKYIEVRYSAGSSSNIVVKSTSNIYKYNCSGYGVTEGPILADTLTANLKDVVRYDIYSTTYTRYCTPINVVDATPADTASFIVYAPSHGLTDSIALYGYVPVKTNYTKANSSSIDSVHFAYAVGAPTTDSLELKLSGVLSFAHSLTQGALYYLQDDGTEDTTPGTVRAPTAIVLDASTLILSEVGADADQVISRQAIPSPVFTVLGGDPQNPTDSIVQVAVDSIFKPAGLAKPGTIFFTTYTTQSKNPTYQENSPTDKPITPAFSWFYDGNVVTRLNFLLTSVDVEATSAGLYTLTPITVAGSTPTDIEASNWLDTNYVNNNLRLPNGAKIYWQGDGDERNPDYMWEVIDDITNTAETDQYRRILKRVKEPGVGGGFTGTAGSIPFVGSGGSLTENNDSLYWDNTNAWLGIGQSSPTHRISLPSTGNVASEGIIFGTDVGIYRVSAGNLRVGNGSTTGATIQATTFSGVTGGKVEFNTSGIGANFSGTGGSTNTVLFSLTGSSALSTTTGDLFGVRNSFVMTPSTGSNNLVAQSIGGGMQPGAAFTGTLTGVLVTPRFAAAGTPSSEVIIDFGYNSSNSGTYSGHTSLAKIFKTGVLRLTNLSGATPTRLVGANANGDIAAYAAMTDNRIAYGSSGGVTGNTNLTRSTDGTTEQLNIGENTTFSTKGRLNIEAMESDTTIHNFRFLDDRLQWEVTTNDDLDISSFTQSYPRLRFVRGRRIPGSTTALSDSVTTGDVIGSIDFAQRYTGSLGRNGLSLMVVAKDRLYSRAWFERGSETAQVDTLDSYRVLEMDMETRDVRLPGYGTGVKTGTPAYFPAYTSDGWLIETGPQSGSGAPGTTPTYLGEIYIDTSGGVIYMAAGTSSSADWKQISN